MLKTPSVKFSTDLARYLLPIAFNVELSNCSNLPIPPLPHFDVDVQINGKSFGGRSRMFAHFYHSKSLGVTIISFSGTWFLDEWVKVFDAKQTAPTKLNSYAKTPSMLIHTGFYQIYLSVQTEIQSLLKKYHLANDVLYLTGHSLGGALSTICASDLYAMKPVLYTFASPRVFNIQGATFINDNIAIKHRIFNTEDIFTTLPPPENSFGTKYGLYEHVQPAEMFTTNIESVPDNHTLAYLLHFGLVD